MVSPRILPVMLATLTLVIMATESVPIDKNDHRYQEALFDEQQALFDTLLAQGRSNKNWQYNLRNPVLDNLEENGFVAASNSEELNNEDFMSKKRKDFWKLAVKRFDDRRG